MIYIQKGKVRQEQVTSSDFLYHRILHLRSLHLVVIQLIKQIFLILRG